MMGDVRSALYGTQRSELEDKHTEALYALARDRYETINGLLSALRTFCIVAVAASAAIAVAGVIWVWKVLG